MPRQLILMGASEGPWCSLVRFPRPAIRVTGLTEGHVMIEVRSDKGFGMLAEITKDGTFDLSNCVPRTGYENPRFDWIRAAASHPHKELICVVIPTTAPQPWVPVGVLN